MQSRQATVADAPSIARIHVATWCAAYRGQIPDAILNALDVNKRETFWCKHLAAEQHGVWVAELSTEIIGFCELIPSRDADANPQETGEIAAVYVQPEFWRKGAGLTLCRRALEQARLHNFTTVTLWVLNSNVAARNFYESIGFHSDGAKKIEKSFENYELHEVRYKFSL